MTRERLPDLAFAAACLVAFLVLSWLGSGLTFVRDEWSAILLADDWSIDGLMRPVNEHWSLALRLVWNTLIATVGLRSYVPYLGIEILLHIAVAVGLYVYARRQTSGLIALAIGVLFLFLGSGSENLYLAFLMNFTGPAALGTWALVILMREPAPKLVWLAALLLLVAVAGSTVGLFFVAAAAAVLIASPERRRHLWVVVPASLAYAAWYVSYGRDTVRSTPPPEAIVDFVRDGIANAVGQVSGLGAEVGLILAVLFAIAAIADVAGGGRLRLGLVAGSVGLLSQWLLTALGRAGALQETFVAGRYVYVAAVFILIAFIGWFGQRSLGHPRERLRLVVAVAAVAGVALAWNGSRLLWFHDHWDAQAAEYRAAVTLLSEYGGSPAFPADRGMVLAPGGLRIAEPGEGAFFPGPERLRTILRRYGSPLDDPLAIRGVRTPDAALDRLFAAAVADSIAITPGLAEPGTVPPALVDAVDATATPVGACLSIDVTGDRPAVDVSVGSGATLAMTSEVAGTGAIIVSLKGTFAGEERAFETRPGQTLLVKTPDIGPDRTVAVRLLPPSEGSSRLCTTAAQGSAELTGEPERGQPTSRA